MTTIIIIFFSFLLIVFIFDRFIQRKHIILKHFPVIGHLRYLLEKIGPEMRQYFVAQNREEFPFNRIQRSYIYASAKNENPNQAFGSDADFNKVGHFFIKQSTFPYKPDESFNKYDLKPIKIIGKNRRKPFQPKSIINISGMSYGALGRATTEANNRAAKIAECYHNTGEGGFSPYHNNGADVVFQIGTAYYGCRDENGKFNMMELIRLCKENPCIKMIEIKLSQGAKPGKGGILPKEKVTAEIAKIRNIKINTASISPGFHTEFRNVKTLIKFIEDIADLTGLPVGIKSAVGEETFWWDLANEMATTKTGPNFITIDGGEGGTGASPAHFSDHMSLPFDNGFSEIYKIFKKSNLINDITFIGSGKLGLPANAIKAFALGVDMINIARETMLSAGCIQAQKCHTNSCPTLIASNNKQHLLNIPFMSTRISTYIKTLRKDINEMTHACGYDHPSQLNTSDIVVNTNTSNTPQSLEKIYDYRKN